MLLRLVSPMRRSGSAIPQFAQRIPAEVRLRAIGRVLDVPLGPAGDVRVRITPNMETLRFSLRSRDPSEVKQRHATVAAYLEKVWAGLRRDRPWARGLRPRAGRPRGRALPRAAPPSAAPGASPNGRSPRSPPLSASRPPPPARPRVGLGRSGGGPGPPAPASPRRAARDSNPSNSKMTGRAVPGEPGPTPQAEPDPRRLAASRPGPYC